MALPMNLPTGTITCLFSDIEGSTQMLRELGPDFEDVLRRHHDLLRAAWNAHDGHEVQKIGDAFFVVFSDSGNAVAAAIAAQRALAEDEWPGRVRDFDSPIELYAATAEGVPAPEAQPRVPPAEGHNMTRPTTSIVGRDDDLARLGDRIAPRTVTTLIGPGGVGKTRLAIEAALNVARDWEHGAWFIDLAPLDDPALIPETIGAAVGAPVVRSEEHTSELQS